MPSKTTKNSVIRESLVKLADKFDREGKGELADEVDTLLSVAARPKAPLKTLDDDVKKDLLKFIHRVKENIEDSMEALEEFFRRLRYFDIGDTVKDLKLDKALKELEKTNECIDAASKSMYALTHGKHPSKADMEQMAEDFGSKKKETESPLEFFENQKKPEEKDDEYSHLLPHERGLGFISEEPEYSQEYIDNLANATYSELGGEEENPYESDEEEPDPSDFVGEDEDMSDEEYEEFMKGLHEPEEDESFED